MGVVTSGGDAPGMNAAVWRLALACEARGWEAVAVRFGYAGLLEGRIEPLESARAARLARRGGTWLGTARVPDLHERLDALASATGGLDGLVVLGGGGSLAAARALAARLPVVGIPATIDNDVAGTDLSLGFATAVAHGLDAADRLRDTAEALPRLFTLETLGGPTGHLASAVGRLAGATAVLIPEVATREDAVAEAVRATLEAGEPALVVASEGVPELGAVLERLSASVGMRLRDVRLGHAQRGGAPCPRDRALAAALAEVAAEGLAERRGGLAALRSGAPALVPFPDRLDADPPDARSWRGLL